MKKNFWKLCFLFLAVIVPLGFQNCTPAFKAIDSVGTKSLSSLSAKACGEQVSGSRWWEVDSEIEVLTCGNNHNLPQRYYIEKSCDNGVIFATGQRIADSTNPVCQTACQFLTQTWTVNEGYINLPDICNGGVAVNAFYERKAQYKCVNSVPVATGTFTPGAKIAGGCDSTGAAPTCKNASSQAQAEGMVWQERLGNYSFTQGCLGGNTQLTCERHFEFQCAKNVKQLTSRGAVLLNCQSNSQCPQQAASCQTSEGLRTHLSTWTKRISPDFTDAGPCAQGGDLMITSERLQTYKCDNGTIYEQQVVRGANIAQIGQCGPKSCTMASGTGQQKWVTVGSSSQWGPCEATTCQAGYKIDDNVCVLDKSIEIITANYADNYGYSGNATDHVKLICEGKRTCAYLISTDNLGDPVWGSSKDFKVYYTCHDGIQRVAYQIPEANTQTVTLSCAQ